MTNLLYDDVVSIKSYGCMLFILQSGRSVYESQSFKESVWELIKKKLTQKKQWLAFTLNIWNNSCVSYYFKLHYPIPSVLRYKNNSGAIGGPSKACVSQTSPDLYGRPGRQWEPQQTWCKTEKPGKNWPTLVDEIQKPCDSTRMTIIIWIKV